MSVSSFRFGSAALAIVALSLVSGCSHHSRENEPVIHVAIEEEAKTLDPANTYDGISLAILPEVVESLYQYDFYANETKVIPLLAAGMPKTSADGKHVTVKIRPGIQYAKDAAFGAAGTRELVASDFIYAIKRLAHPGVQSQGRWVFDGRLAGFTDLVKKLEAAPKDKLAAEFESATLPGVRALDAHTLEFNFEKPYPQFIYILTMSFVAPVPPEAVAKYGDEHGQINDHMVGTGPFILKDWKRGFSVSLVKNPNFRHEEFPLDSELAGKTMPAVDAIEYTIQREDQPRWLAFMKGDIDFVRIPKDNYAVAIKDGELMPELVDKGIRLEKVRPIEMYYFTLNMTDPALANKKVRQALNAAIDRKKWINLFTNDRGTEMAAVAPPGLIDRPADLPLTYKYDLERAKKLLAEAGYPGGKGLPPLTFEYFGTDTATRQLSEFMTNELAKIGVTVVTVLNTNPAWTEKAKTGKLQVSQMSWSLDYPDIENVYQLMSVTSAPPGFNVGSYNNGKVNADYAKLAAMPMGPARAKIAREIETIIQDECPWIFGYYLGDHKLSQGWIQNFHSNPLVYSPYKYFGVGLPAKQSMLAAKSTKSKKR
jgi:oligopeptide transport system substrate-binding protein